MAMRETVGSMRAYFILAAVLSGVMNLLVFRSACLAFSSGWVTALVIMALASVGLLLSVALFWAAIRLRKYLADSPGFVSGIVILIAAFTVIIFLLSLLGGLERWAVIRTAAAILIALYLLTNIKRLSAELRGKQREDLPEDLPTS